MRVFLVLCFFRAVNLLLVLIFDKIEILTWIVPGRTGYIESLGLFVAKAPPAGGVGLHDLSVNGKSFRLITRLGQYQLM